MKKSIYIFFLVPLILSLLAFQGYGFIFKAGVTLSCILILLVGSKSSLKALNDIWFILGAFTFSIIGDWFLSNKDESLVMFAAGIGFYFLAHAGYLIYAIKNGSLNKTFTLFILAIYLLFFAIVLWPAINDAILLISVILYLLISCFSVGASFNLFFSPVVRWSYFAGVVLILLSDTVISFKEFTSYQQLNFLILPTYYAAHMLITLSLIGRKKSN